MSRRFTSSLFTNDERSASRVLILVGVIFHLLCLASIFDIYFTSPLTHGMQPVEISTGPPAKRLVLFVGDGLRADKAFSRDKNGVPLAPFLVGKANSYGRWGVSRTRVPTESRPGHVAMIAGFYEDVSAVTKGWKENPVEFDSVFNQSRYTFGWGSPDIVPMFTYGPGLDDGHVAAHTYPADLEEFGGEEDASKLDTWVFDRVRETMERAAVDPQVAEQMYSDKVVLFMHLLGIDTNGHTHRPSSKEYLDNIKLVDKGIERITEEIEEFYGHDGQTAYVFTADHGMSNRGSHGGGHPDETETPIVCWGAGVANLESSAANEMVFDNLLSASRRIDIEQADVAPLMASLINVPFPMNSVGKLPIEYLNVTQEHKARSLYANSLQMLRVVETAAANREYTSLYFQPFHEYEYNSDDSLGMSVPISAMDEYTTRIEQLIATSQYELALLTTDRFINTLRSAYRYFQTYDRPFLQSLIVVSYFGWLCLVCMFIVYHYTPVCLSRRTQKTKQKGTVTYTMINYTESIEARVQTIERYCTVLMVIAAGLVLYQHLPYHFILYSVLPFKFWSLVIAHYDILVDMRDFMVLQKMWSKTLVVGVAVLIGLEGLVAVFFYRWMLSPMLIVAGVVWPYYVSADPTPRQKSLLLAWATICAVNAIFPLLPVEKHSEPYIILAMGGVLVVGIAAWAKYTTRADMTAKARTTLYAQAAFLLVSLGILVHSSHHLNNKLKVPLLNRAWTWGTIPYALLVPLSVRNERCMATKIVTVCAGFAAPFFMLSISYETAFYACMCITMLLWLSIEETSASADSDSSSAASHTGMSEPDTKSGSKSSVHRNRSGQDEQFVSLGDLHVAFFYLYFLLYAFFGMGNIASISSFDPSSCYRFMTLFSPFVMGALMIGKVLIPEVMVSCTLRGVSAARRVPSTALFLIVVAMSDVMSINFFFLVKDEGSWLEIGTSISHFVINSAVIIFLPLFNLIGYIYTSDPKESHCLHKKTALD
ncbi:hypothetical protein SARC_06762 [Sphaeroforma arctica JP610]|uniref:GPI ethanolamine phosphate transferase 1 n=1 Tax=Sphaeroforma arctica JP610 TaxID=667725 RepID=A0A0L0FVM3_9EUKA|nr:hypothetical protein SARC_06762 [Sphaeroforma arctica JP610]KNC80892.1 hypothetical protein SARC_06762 [Sphaeroforma arctica JP610]|eukprot:XP_014154794.1 hypothetical protein SARC_06762 [Sphaeroforma arctica JP610]